MFFSMSMYQSQSGVVLYSGLNICRYCIISKSIFPLFFCEELSFSAGKSGHVAALVFRYELYLSNARCHERFVFSLGMLYKVQ